MDIPNVLGQTPGFNGYGVTLDDKPKPKSGSGLMNVFSKVMEFGAPEAFEAGRQKKYRRNLTNAFKSGDMGAASDALFDMGEYGAGMDLRESVQAQQGAQQSEQARMAYEMTKGLLNEPDVMRRVQMAQQMSQQLGLPAPTDPSEFTNEAITQNLEMMRIKGGFDQDQAADQFTLSPGARRFDEQGNLVAENPRAQNELPWYITEDGVDPRYIEAQRAGGDGGSAAPRVQSSFVGEDGQRYVIMSDGSARGLGVNERNLGQIVDVGGVPTLVNRQNASEVPLSSLGAEADAAATVTEATETASANVSQKAEDRQARIGYARRAKSQIPKLEAAIKAVDDAIETSNARNTGAIKVPFSGVQALSGLLTTLEANLAFNELGDMRRNSPTGGALGNVSEGELSLLGSTIANLSQDQSEARLDKNLGTVRESLSRLLSALEEDASYTVEASTLAPDLQSIDDEIAQIDAQLAAVGGAQ